MRFFDTPSVKQMPATHEDFPKPEDMTDDFVFLTREQFDAIPLAVDTKGDPDALVIDDGAARGPGYCRRWNLPKHGWMLETWYGTAIIGPHLANLMNWQYIQIVEAEDGFLKSRKGKP
jgi:hypothetical protein